MPRKARIDTPGALHHILCRGIERRKIFADDDDHDNFLERLGIILKETSTPCYGWALIPNHFHLLLRTGKVPISTVMRKLTEEWRKANPDVEPADKLLERILRKNDKSQDRARKPPIDTLPECWCVATMDQLTDYITSGSRGWAKYYSNSGDLFIRAQNLKNDKIELDDVAYVQLPQRVEGKRTLIQRNDILITVTGANVTKSGIMDHKLDRKAYVNQHIALTRPAIPEISEYLFLWIICPAYGRRDLEKSAYGAGKPGLNLANIRELVVALPPLEEQEEIIAEIERLLSLSDDLEKAVDKALRRADRLRQSILKKAFSGKLIPQNNIDGSIVNPLKRSA